MGTRLKIVTDIVGKNRGPAPSEEGAPEYDVIEKHDELRYTLGPVYSPGVLDAQGEFTDSEELRKMVWRYFSEGDKTLRKEHTEEAIGKVVEIIQWPFEQELDMGGRAVRIRDAESSDQLIKFDG
jgi:hypothetical protein